jgi:hypothetical protein
MHLSLCLNRLRYAFQWATDRNRINVILHDLNDSDELPGLDILHRRLAAVH